MKIKQLEKELAERVKNLDNMLEKCKKDCPVVYDLFNSSGMVFYRMFKMHDSFENVEHIVYALHHAFVDDGEFYVVKEMDKPVTEMRKRLSNKTGKDFGNEYYTYHLKEWHGSGVPVNQKQLSRLLCVQNTYEKYNKRNRQNIDKWKEDRSYLSKSVALCKKCTGVFEAIYQENNR